MSRKKAIRKFLKVLLYLAVFNVAVLNLYIVFSGNTYIYKAVYYNLVNIDDYKIFHNRTVEAPPEAQAWPVSSRYNTLQPPNFMRDTLAELNSVALVVVHKDSIIHEEYWDGYGDSAKSNSFSMAKSFVGAMIGIAVAEGKIKSIDDPIADYLPEYKDKALGRVPIKHFLMMASGSSYDESYINPFSYTTKIYYGTDTRALMATCDSIEPSGRLFKYRSGDSQILSFIIKEATGKTLSAYMSEKLWKPMGAKHAALWCLDQEGGYEKAYCCINSNARDFARFGKLFLHKGRWNGRQIVPKDFVEASLRSYGLVDDKDQKVDFYGYQWWLIPDFHGHEVYYCRGILGQYIICVPDWETVIVRLGKKRGANIDEPGKPYYGQVDDVLTYLRGVEQMLGKDK